MPDYAFAAYFLVRPAARVQLAVASAAALTGATVVAIDARLPWDALFTILAAEAPRALIMSPRGPPLNGEAGEDRAAALAERFAPELARFTGGAVWGYDPLESKRFRALKYIVQTGFDDVPGVVQLADLASVGSGASQAARLRARCCVAARAAVCAWRALSHNRLCRSAAPLSSSLRASHPTHPRLPRCFCCRAQTASTTSTSSSRCTASARPATR